MFNLKDAGTTKTKRGFNPYQKPRQPDTVYVPGHGLEPGSMGYVTSNVPDTVSTKGTDAEYAERIKPYLSKVPEAAAQKQTLFEKRRGLMDRQNYMLDQRKELADQMSPENAATLQRIGENRNQEIGFMSDRLDFSPRAFRAYGQQGPFPSEEVPSPVVAGGPLMSGQEAAASDPVRASSPNTGGPLMPGPGDQKAWERGRKADQLMSNPRAVAWLKMTAPYMQEMSPEEFRTHLLEHPEYMEWALEAVETSGGMTFKPESMGL